MSAIWIEAVQPVRFHYEGREVVLRRGERVSLPVLTARRLLSRAKEKVRPVDHATWLSLWRVVAEVSNGLMPDDPRLAPVLRVIEGLDRAFAADDFSAFEQGMTDLREAMKGERKRDA